MKSVFKQKFVDIRVGGITKGAVIDFLGNYMYY